MASIRRRWDKWQVQVRRKGSPSVTHSFIRKNDAELWARQIESEADRKGLKVDPRVLQNTTVRQIVERYRDTVTVTKRGKVNETIILDALLRQPFSDLSLADASSDTFAKYRDERLKTVKATTIRRELSLLHHAFDLARQEWNIPTAVNPLRGVRRPPQDKARDRRLEPGELDTLVTGCRKSRNKFLLPLIYLAVETGMRRGELLNIRWGNFDPAKHTLHIPLTKTGIPRTIPLTGRAIEVLKGIEPSEDHRVFPIAANALRLAWQRLTKRVRIPDLHFHDLRHEAISRFFEMGLSIPEVALISGHRDYRMLFRYTHLRAEDVGKKLL